MNKLLPIILVVVLSGCSFFSSEYECSRISENNYYNFLKITSSEIIRETVDFTHTYEIDSETPTKISASYVSSNGQKHKATFHKKLLRADFSGYSGRYAYDYSFKCRDFE